MSRHKAKQFQTSPPKKPLGGHGIFNDKLQYPVGVAKYDDTTGKAVVAGWGWQ